jgi:hypothetical protein
MEGNNVLVTAAAIVIISVAGCLTYLNVVDSNNNKEIVSRAIERGMDPLQASCAANISTNSKDIRTTCEKLAIIKGK